MFKNPGDYAMVKSMNDIGHSLALREIGVDYAQGYASTSPVGWTNSRRCRRYGCGRNGQKKRR
jgi:hypothetical protein